MTYTKVKLNKLESNKFGFRFAGFIAWLVIMIFSYYNFYVLKIEMEFNLKASTPLKGKCKTHFCPIFILNCPKQMGPCCHSVYLLYFGWTGLMKCKKRSVLWLEWDWIGAMGQYHLAPDELAGCTHEHWALQIGQLLQDNTGCMHITSQHKYPAGS